MLKIVVLIKFLISVLLTVTISDIVVRTEYLYSVPSCQCIKAGLDVNTKAV